MAWRMSPRDALLLTVVLALGSVAALHRFSPAPVADTRRGSEQAFASGLEPREFEDGLLARRWAGRRLVMSFVNLPPGPVDIEVAVRSQRHPVVVGHAGAVLGVIPPGQTEGRYALPAAEGGRVQLELAADTFVARGGRQLGFLLERVSVRPRTPGAWPPWSLVVMLGLPAVVALLTARAAGWPPGGALVLAAGLLGIESAALVPYGLVRSPYAAAMAAWLVAGTLVSGFLARRLTRRVTGDSSGARSGAFLALLVAFLVQGVAASHPCLVASDAVFHAHNLEAVALGDLSLTSLTPHDPPFRFPYGVSFYVALVPLLHTGLETTTLVRFGAAAAGLASAVGLLAWWLPTGAARAAWGVGLLQLLPVTFHLVSAGNYSNVFAQALTVLFLAWWSGAAPGGFAVGALLFAVAATAHFGGLLFLLSLGASLVLSAGRGLCKDRTRLAGLCVGVIAAALYYARFFDLMAGQAPRLLQATGSAGPGPLVGLLAQLSQARLEWGWPVVILAAFALWARRGADRGTAALALAGAPFLLAAVVSPLEVRYLYAVAPAVALLAADGIVALGVGLRGRALAGLAVALQAWLGVAGLVRAVLERYRA